MKWKPMTLKQQTVFGFLETYLQEHGFPPTLKEIGDAIGLPNINAVRGHLQALEKKGYITKSPDRARSIRIIYSPSPINRLKRKLHEILRTDDGVFHQITYGIAWTTWQRKPFLSGQVANWISEAICREVEKRGWSLFKEQIKPDHIILIVKTWPNHSAERTVVRFQNAAKSIKQSHPGRFPKKGLWGKGYVATTTIELLDDMVARMLENQEHGEE